MSNSSSISNIRKAYIVSVGLNIEDYKSWSRKFDNLKEHTKKRDGINCLLSFNDYIDLAIQAGIKSPNQIGSRSGYYCLGRFGDEGDYVIGNCRFITTDQNHKEAIDNGAYTVVAEALKGKTKPEHSILMRSRNKDNTIRLKLLSDKMTGRTKLNNDSVARMAISKSKSFVVKSPTGETFSGIGFTEFCKSHKLDSEEFSKVCRGVSLKKSYKGWTGNFVEVSV